MEKSARYKLSSGKNLSFAPIATDNNNDARLPGESRRVSRERNFNDKSRRKDDRRRNEENPLNPDSRKSRMEENLNNDVEVKSRHAKSTKNNYSEPMNSFDKGRAKDGNEDEGEKSKTNGDINDGKKDQDLFLPPAPANKTEKCPLCRKQFPSEGKLRHHRSLDHRHKCQHCSRAYLLKPDLAHHILKVHKKIVRKDHQDAASEKNEVILPRIHEQNLNPAVDKCQVQVENVIESPPLMPQNIKVRPVLDVKEEFHRDILHKDLYISESEEESIEKNISCLKDVKDHFSVIDNLNYKKSKVVCKLCSKTLAKSSYLEHFRTFHLDIHGIPKVHFRKSQGENWKRVRTSKNQNRTTVKIKCEFCGNKILKCNMARHEREVHKKKWPKCKTCGRVFMQLEAYQYHINTKNH